MTGDATIIGGIVIPSTDPAFLAVVIGVHIPLGIVCVLVGASAMLSEKRRGRHSIFGTIYYWCLLALFRVRHFSFRHALVEKVRPDSAQGIADRQSRSDHL
jgi:hypothetical protein